MDVVCPVNLCGVQNENAGEESKRVRVGRRARDEASEMTPLLLHLVQHRWEDRGEYRRFISISTRESFIRAGIPLSSPLVPSSSISSFYREVVRALATTLPQSPSGSPSSHRPQCVAPVHSTQCSATNIADRTRTVSSCVCVCASAVR